jgi:sugar/nucleoside kinase (ribokinase family)
MLTETVLDQILDQIPRLTVGVLGDLFLDRYLDLDASLTEPSLETGLDAYQVVRVRSYPGAAGTVINNLVALGAKGVYALSVIGDDGEGHELLQALRRLRVVHTQWLLTCPARLGFRTPTYTKPMLHEPGRPARELNRLDIRNRTPVQPPLDEMLLPGLIEAFPQLDALLVLDQVGSGECGIVSRRVRDVLAELGTTCPEKLILADSRERVGEFRSVWLKPNEAECRRAAGGPATTEEAAAALARRTGRPVFCTCGERGMLLADPRAGEIRTAVIPACPVSGPIDVVGAGDSTSAGIACAVAAGATPEEAAAFGNLVASITIQQLGTTGTATPAQVRTRWAEL